MTTALYYQDPMARTFSAEVVTVDRNESMIRLDRTLFYPEGGGQPADRGTIRTADGLLTIAVTDVRKRDDGEILHMVEAQPEEIAALTPGTLVKGVLDWSHRYDYMQQHTGQHLLSAGLLAVAGAATVSVHQGTDMTTIEVDRPEVDAAIIRAVEEWVAERIAADLPVRALTVDSTELGAYPLRRPTKRTGRVRLVEIEETDLVACGGVHLPRTACIGLVLAMGVERIRGNTRLAFTIGRRALDQARTARDALKQTADLFSAHPAQVPERADALIGELKQTNGELRRRSERLADTILQGFRDAVVPHALLLRDEPDDLFDVIASRAAETFGVPGCLLNVTPRGTRWAIVLPATGATLAKRVRTELLEPFGAKGGGKPPLLRGVLSDDADAATPGAFAAAFERFAAS